MDILTYWQSGNLTDCQLCKLTSWHTDMLIMWQLNFSILDSRSSDISFHGGDYLKQTNLILSICLRRFCVNMLRKLPLIGRGWSQTSPDTSGAFLFGHQIRKMETQKQTKLYEMSMGPGNRCFWTAKQKQKDVYRNIVKCDGPDSSPSFMWNPLVKKRKTYINGPNRVQWAKKKHE